MENVFNDELITDPFAFHILSYHEQWIHERTEYTTNFVFVFKMLIHGLQLQYFPTDRHVQEIYFKHYFYTNLTT